MKIKIVCGQRGWLWVGEYSTDGEFVIVENAYVVRRWGTTEGLGQLAQDGPTKETILDRAGTVRLHQLCEVFSMDCNQEAWTGVL